MSPRSKRLVVLVVFLLAAGAAAFAIWRAPQLDLVPVAKRFLVDLDEGRTLQALQGSQMQDRWDLVGILEHNKIRQRRLGRLVKVESATPMEEIELKSSVAKGTGRRLRLTAAFEHGKDELTFTFARVNTTWVVQDFEFAALKSPQVQGLDKHMRRVAKQIAEEIAQLRWGTVHGRLLRADRIGIPMEVWTLKVENSLNDLGAFQRVEERAWTYAEGRAKYGARLVFENGPKDVDFDLVFDPTEGRPVITRLEFL